MTIHSTIRGAAITIAGLAAVALLTVAHYQAAIAELTFRLTGAQVEAMGPNWTKARTARDLAAMVPALADQLARAKKAGTKPVAAVNVKSGEASFTFPDWLPGGSTAPPGLTPALQPEAAGALPPLPRTEPQLLVSAEAQGALTGLADGSVLQTWAMFASVRQPGGEPQRRQLCGQDDGHLCDGGLTIDPAIEKAWRDAIAPKLIRWRELSIGGSMGDGGPGVVVGYGQGGKRFGVRGHLDYVIGDPTKSRVAVNGAVRF